MRYEKVHLEGFGYVLPDNVVTSMQIERELAEVYRRFNLHEGRLELMSGIKERRFWDEGAVPSEGSTLAGKRALEASGVAPEGIECLLHTSVSRDFLEPATASLVHRNLSLSPKALFYDISNACLGFLNGMTSLGDMIELGHVRRGLIVAGESSRQLVRSTMDFLRNSPHLTRQQLKQAFASLTIGSAAVALVMAHASVSKTNHRLVGGVLRTATQHSHLCQGSHDTGFSPDASMVMSTEAETLLVNGCRLAAETWSEFKDALGWRQEEINRSYCHQVGQAHRDRFLESIGLDPAIDFSTFPFLGNVGSVSLPLTMAMGIERDPPAEGDKLALLGIGSGLCCAMLGVAW